MDLTIQTVVSGTGITTITKSTVISVDAFDKVAEVDVAGLASDFEIAVSPGTAALIQLVFMYADSYVEAVPGTPDLTVKFHVNTEPAMILDGPLTLIKGQDDAVEACDSIFVSNAGADPRTISVFVGRNTS
jgi:hypothetical protein